MPVPEGSNDTEEDIAGKIEDQEGATKACRDTDVHDDDGGPSICLQYAFDLVTFIPRPS